MFKKGPLHFTDERRIEIEGQKDGERNIPEMGSYSPAQFEHALVSHGEQEVQRIFEKGSRRLTKLQPEFEACRKRFQDVESRLQAVVTRYKARKEQLGRDLSVRFPYRYHVALVVFLAIGEFPLNTIVFRLFGEPEFLTYVMASTLAITIPLLGLFVGLHLRQSIPRTAGNIMISVLTPVAVAAALYSISRLRNTYIFAQASLSSPLASNQDELAYALLSLNALVFCGAMVSSFFSHDVDEILDSCHNSLIFLDRRRNAARMKQLRLGTKINGEIQRAKSRVQQARALTSQRVSLYRQTNMRFRRLTAPPSFRREPEFRQVEWWPEVSLNHEESAS